MKILITTNGEYIATEEEFEALKTMLGQKKLVELESGCFVSLDSVKGVKPLPTHALAYGKYKLSADGTAYVKDGEWISFDFESCTMEEINKKIVVVPELAYSSRPDFKTLVSKGFSLEAPKEERETFTQRQQRMFLEEKKRQLKLAKEIE